MMEPGISHDWADETPEAKAAWFRSLTLEERMEFLCAITDLILVNNPTIMDQRDARPTQGSIRVVSRP